MAGLLLGFAFLASRSGIAIPMQTKSEELSSLQAMLKAREGKTGYAANVEAIKARIEQLKKEGA